MTALTFIIEPDQIRLAMDTLIINSVDKKPRDFQRKFLPLPDSNLLIAGTGYVDFINGWFDYISQYFPNANIDELNKIAPDIFRASVLNSSEGLFGLTATIYHFGYSNSDKGYIGIAYRSTNNFFSERLPIDSLVWKPSYQLNFSEDLEIELPKLFIEIIQELQNLDKLSTNPEPVGIGGNIEFVLMKNNSIQIQTVHQFDSYKEELEFITHGEKT